MTDRKFEVYEAPELFELGTAQELTRGWLFSFCENHCGRQWC